MSSNDGNVPPEKLDPFEEFLVRLDGKIDRLSSDVADIKRRLAAVEAGVVGQSLGLDRVISRLDQIEERVGARREDPMPITLDTPRQQTGGVAVTQGSPLRRQGNEPAAVANTITHYGLNWQTNEVYWGGDGGKPGAILGRRQAVACGPEGEVRYVDEIIDFGQFDGIYCLYGGGMLQYVGATEPGHETLFDALAGHRRDSLARQWFTFSWFGCNPRDGEKFTAHPLRQLKDFAASYAIPDLIDHPHIPGVIEVRQVAHEDSTARAGEQALALLDELIAIYTDRITKKQTSS